MHLRARHPPFRNHPVQHRARSAIVLVALYQGSERAEPCRVHDLVPSLQFDNDTVVERSSPKNLADERAGDVAACDTNHSWERRYPFGKGDFDITASES
jgi:hypothetical protein